jgi:predicted transglutaminase-like protease
LQNVQSAKAKKVQNAKSEKLEEALIKKMQINANKKHYNRWGFESFKRQVKFHLPYPGIIGSSPYSPC